jgi:hypothetical protein
VRGRAGCTRLILSREQPLLIQHFRGSAVVAWVLAPRRAATIIEQPTTMQLCYADGERLSRSVAAAHEAIMLQRLGRAKRGANMGGQIFGARPCVLFDRVEPELPISGWPTRVEGKSVSPEDSHGLPGRLLTAVVSSSSNLVTWAQSR